MTSLNFLLTRALGRTLERGRRDRRHPARSRRERLAVAGAGTTISEIVVRFAGVHEDLSLDLDDLEAQLSDRTKRRRVPGRLERGRDDARRGASRRARSRRRRARLGRRRPLRAARADRRRRLGRRRAPLLAVQVLRPAHGAGVRQAGAARERGARTRCGRRRTSPSDAGSSTARCQHELLAGFVACVEYVDVARLGRDRRARARSWARRFLDGLPEPVELYGLRDDGGPRADVLLQPPGPRGGGSRRPSSPRARSRSGTATTTPSRS